MRILRNLYNKYIRYADSSSLKCLNEWIKSVYTLPIVQKIMFHAWEDDETRIRKLYKRAFGVEPDLEHPKLFNEKNNWRKLHDHKPIYNLMVDKYRCKEIVKERLGEEYTFKLLGHWNRPEDIDFDSLPDKFVLKPNHSNGVLICLDKSKFDCKDAVKRLKKAMRVNYFIRSREWPYRDVKRCILAEEYMGTNLCDYKNYVFNGKLMYTLVWKNIPNKEQKPTAYFCGMYDRNWQRTDMELDYPSLPDIVEKPKCYDDMVRCAEAMAKDTIFIRCDCYVIDDHVYVGETTFFPWGGFQKFKDEKWNRKLGEFEHLPDRDA